jgi:hypothetical protein
VNGTVQLQEQQPDRRRPGQDQGQRVRQGDPSSTALVEGDLFGSERVIIRKSAQVRGNITSPRVAIEEGARFKGSIEMDSAAVESDAGQEPRIVRERHAERRCTSPERHRGARQAHGARRHSCADGGDDGLRRGVMSRFRPGHGG